MGAHTGEGNHRRVRYTQENEGCTRGWGYIEEWGKTHPLTSFPKENFRADECHFYKMEIYTQNLSTLF